MNNKPIIFSLTPWPTAQPRHAGQLFARAIADQFLKNGFAVFSTGIASESDPPEALSPNDVVIRDADLRQVWIHSQVDFWKAVAAFCGRSVGDRYKESRATVLLFHEPWLWPIVRDLFDQGILKNSKVIFVSKNFETKSLIDQIRSGANISLFSVEAIANFEKDICTAVDLVTCVSEADGNSYRSIGAKNVVTVRYGSRFLPQENFSPSMEALIPKRNYALFVSSDHPPNAMGLLQTALAPGIQPLQHGNLVVAGKVVSMLKKSAKAFASPILSRASYLGFVHDDLLQRLLLSASVIVLPKTLGGGSNLKTVEALVSGRQIVATPAAFIGFEEFMTYSGVIVAEEPKTFWLEVDRVLASRITEAVSERAEIMSQLTWESGLSPLIAVVREMVIKKI